MNGTPLQELLEVLGDGLAQPRVLWSVLAIVVAVAVGWLVAQRVRRHARDRLAALGDAASPSDALRFSIEGFRRLAFPVTAMFVLWVASGAMVWAGLVKRTADARVLRTALVLFGAMALIRLLVYALRRALPRVHWLGPFERWLALAIWIGVALHMTGWSAHVIGWLEAIELPVGAARVSLWDLGVGVVTVLLTLLAALWAGSALEARLLHAQALDANVRAVLARLARALLILVAVLLSLSLAGIDLTVLSVFGGALGVGLGLGLQRIASSYVSGFIILMDRSLRIGDMITVDKYTGKVTDIKARYTVLRGVDGHEAIIPNEKLVAEPVVNLSYSNPEVMLRVDVQVSYATDVDQALAILVDAARTVDRVVAEPPPAAALAGFGADGLNLSLMFWIADPANGRLNVTSDVNREILRRLRAEGIEIPFPQRDIRIVGRGLPESPARN